MRSHPNGQTGFVELYGYRCQIVKSKNFLRTSQKYPRSVITNKPTGCCWCFLSVRVIRKQQSLWDSCPGGWDSTSSYQVNARSVQLWTVFQPVRECRWETTLRLRPIWGSKGREGTCDNEISPEKLSAKTFLSCPDSEKFYGRNAEVSLEWMCDQSFSFQSKALIICFLNSTVDW